MVNGSNSPSAKLSLRMRRVASYLFPNTYESRGVFKSRGRTSTLLDKQKLLGSQQTNSGCQGVIIIEILVDLYSHGFPHPFGKEVPRAHSVRRVMKMRREALGTLYVYIDGPCKRRGRAQFAVGF